MRHLMGRNKINGPYFLINVYRILGAKSFISSKSWIFDRVQYASFPFNKAKGVILFYICTKMTKSLLQPSPDALWPLQEFQILIV